MTADVDERDDRADERAPDDERPVSWGPTWGPEREADDARPAPKREVRGWHPPGGPW